jgi:hypothetical protein
MMWLPNTASIVVVMDTALPAASITEMWLVAGISESSSGAQAILTPAGTPGAARFMLASGRISALRVLRYSGETSAAAGTFTKSGSPT